MISCLKPIHYIFVLTKKIKTTLEFSVHNAHKQIPCLLSSHLLNFILPQDNQWPRGTTCARKLRYTEFKIMQLDTNLLQYIKHLQINILKPSRCLNSIPRQVFFINFSRGSQISYFQSHARLPYNKC